MENEGEREWRGVSMREVGTMGARARAGAQARGRGGGGAGRGRTLGAVDEKADT